MKSNYGSSLLLLSSFLYEIFSFRLGFSWDVINFFKYFMVHCAITIIQYCWKENKNRYMIRSNGGPWKISFKKKKHHRRTLFNTSFYFILHQSLQYHLNSMFHFSLGPMFLSAFLRDWGVISFDILTVTVMTTGSWLVL